MHESEPLKGLTAPVEETPVDNPNPSLIILSVLMRIYDVQMGIYREMNSDLARSMYEAHAAGESFNPGIFLPNFSASDDEA